ncbi:MAG: hypothetical protein HPM95_02295 [Alphaproteobacteria bacterium]|nr:hypothetical protein [Alphaproteobacteria bacterium]
MLLVLVSYTANRVAKSIYLELAERRAATIARDVATVAPETWAALLSGRGDASPDLAQAFAGEMRELALGDLGLRPRRPGAVFQQGRRDRRTRAARPAPRAGREGPSSPSRKRRTAARAMNSMCPSWTIRGGCGPSSSSTNR